MLQFTNLIIRVATGGLDGGGGRSNVTPDENYDDNGKSTMKDVSNIRGTFQFPTPSMYYLYLPTFGCIFLSSKLVGLNKYQWIPWILWECHVSFQGWFSLAENHHGGLPASRHPSPPKPPRRRRKPRSPPPPRRKVWVPRSKRLGGGVVGRRTNTQKTKQQVGWLRKDGKKGEILYVIVFFNQGLVHVDLDW